MTAGAYGAVQGSTYNTRPLLPEILVKGDEWAVVRPRQTYDELIGMDRIAALARQVVTRPPCLALGITGSMLGLNSGRTRKARRG